MTRLTVGVILTLTFPMLAVAQSRSPSGTTRQDVFSTVRCGQDVAKALVGKAFHKERVAAIESAHRDIGLKNTGGSEVSDSLFLGGWMMCGGEYQLLQSPRGITDALRFPAHSRRRPAFFGTCALNGRKLPDAVLAVLDNPEPPAAGEPPYSPEDTTPLKAIVAWRVDAARARLVPLPTTALTCPRGGIHTVDGGT